MYEEIKALMKRLLELYNVVGNVTPICTRMIVEHQIHQLQNQLIVCLKSPEEKPNLLYNVLQVLPDGCEITIQYVECGIKFGNIKVDNILRSICSKYLAVTGSHMENGEVVFEVVEI